MGVKNVEAMMAVLCGCANVALDYKVKATCAVATINSSWGPETNPRSKAVSTLISGTAALFIYNCHFRSDTDYTGVAVRNIPPLEDGLRARLELTLLVRKLFWPFWYSVSLSTANTIADCHHSLIPGNADVRTYFTRFHVTEFHCPIKWKEE